jgi:hypothetical protein
LEIKLIKIPDISTINLKYYIPYSSVLNVSPMSIDILGCVKTHRDSSIKNTQIIEDDPNGAFYSCPNGKMPSYLPIQYNPNKLQIVEEQQKSNSNTPNSIQTDTPEIPKNKEKEIIKINHTFNSQQIEWYRNGSALNLIKANNF